jgi:hypothetical protein
VDHTQCGTADSTSFPVSVVETRVGFKSVANGGSVTSASGYDIAFYSDAGLTTLLDFEIESWSATTGALVAHVRIPTLSHTSNTVFYLGYGKSSITTDQSNQHGVWDSNYGCVYHFKDVFGATYPLSTRTDSTSNGNTLTNGASATASAVGQIGDGLNVANQTKILGAVNAASLQCTSAFTIEGWGKPPSFTDYRVLAARGSTTTNRNFVLFTNITTGVGVINFTQSGTLRQVVGATPLSTSVYSHLAATYDGSTLKLWVNGAVDGTLSVSGATDNPSDDFFIGCESYAFTAAYPWLGTIDEVRLSSVARSSSWMTAQYNNQKTSSTFYAVT